MTRPTVFVTSSSGWAIKNLIYTGLLAQLATDARVVVFSQHFREPAMLALARENRFELRRFAFQDESVFAKAVRLLRKKLFLSLHRISTQRIVDKRMGQAWYIRYAEPFIEIIAGMPGVSRLMTTLETLAFALLRVDLYRADFLELKPSLVVVASPFDHQEGPFVRLAKECGAHLATLIPSWDNLSSKGVIFTAYDLFLVWSEKQRRELLAYYPTVNADRVVPVGIPQFDVYAATLPPEFEPANFLKQLGIGADRKVILYSTGPSSLTPDEGDVMLDILDYIRSRPERKLHLLVRMHPHDRFDRLPELAKLPEVTLSHPSRRDHGNMYTWLPPRNELEFLAATLKVAEVCVNLASTMTLDATAANVPCINVAYDGRKSHGYWHSIRRFYETTHYAEVVKTGAAPLAASREELFRHLDEVLADRSLRVTERRQLLLEQGGFEPGGATGRIFAQLHRQLVGGAASGTT